MSDSDSDFAALAPRVAPAAEGAEARAGRALSLRGQLQEAQAINKSLFNLRKVISALAEPAGKRGHVPYRDSKLTRLLRPALSGRVTLVCTVAPDAGEETTNTLHFARRATRVVQAPVPRASPLGARYRQQMDALQTELQEPHEGRPEPQA